jgi:anti-sigma regulatory factor (Ser/Thr protein kinase)
MHLTLATYAALAREIAQEPEPPTALWRLVTSIRAELGIDRAGIFAYDRLAHSLALIAGVDERGRPEFAASVYPMDDELSPLKQVARRELPYYLSEDVRADYPHCPWGLAWRGHGVFPVVAGGALLGILCVDNSLTHHPLPEALAPPLFLYAGLAALPLFALYQQREQERADALRLHLTREVLFSVTEGKFQVCSRDEIDHEWPGFGPGPELIPVRTEADVRAVREAVRSVGETAGMAQERAADLALCASEAATNALLHGGGGAAAVGARDGRVRVRIADQGTGIEPEDLPRATLLKGWSKRSSMGLGFTIIHETADRVYLYTGPGGTTLLIEMSVEPETLAAAANPLLWGEALAV